MTTKVTRIYLYIRIKLPTLQIEGVTIMNCFLLLFNYVCNIFGPFWKFRFIVVLLLWPSPYFLLFAKTVVLPYAFQLLSSCTATSTYWGTNYFWK